MTPLAGEEERGARVMPPVICSAQSLPWSSLPFLYLTGSPSFRALPSSIDDAGHKMSAQPASGVMRPEPLSGFQRCATPPSLPSLPPPKPNMEKAGLAGGVASLGETAAFAGDASVSGLGPRVMPPVTCSAKSLPLPSLPLLYVTGSPSRSALPSSIDEAGHRILALPSKGSMRPDPSLGFQLSAVPPSLPSGLAPPPKPNMEKAPAATAGAATAATIDACPMASGLAPPPKPIMPMTPLAGEEERGARVMPPVICSAQSLPWSSLPFLYLTGSPSFRALPSSIDDAGHKMSAPPASGLMRPESLSAFQRCTTPPSLPSLPPPKPNMEKAPAAATGAATAATTTAARSMASASFGDLPAAMASSLALAATSTVFATASASLGVLPAVTACALT